jgi:hypothetical protein
MRKFLSAYFYFFASIRRIQGAFIENGKFRVVCGNKIVSEHAERINAYMEKTPRHTILCISKLTIIRMVFFIDSPVKDIILFGGMKNSVYL